MTIMERLSRRRNNRSNRYSSHDVVRSTVNEGASTSNDSNNNSEERVKKKLEKLLKNGKTIKDIRIDVLQFLKREIQNKENKKETIKNLAHTIDEYCMDNNIRDDVYLSVSNDLPLCWELDKTR